MLRSAAVVFAVTVAISSESGAFEADKLLSEWITGPNKVHQAVQLHEREPLSEKAEQVQPILAAHFKAVDYIICGDVLGPLFDSDNDIHHIIGWQIIFGSGDWVEQHPEQADDIDAYTLAGLESGLRAYATVSEQKPKAKSKLLNELLTLYRNDQLRGWVDDNPCRPE